MYAVVFSADNQRICTFPEYRRGVQALLGEGSLKRLLWVIVSKGQKYQQLY